MTESTHENTGQTVYSWKTVHGCRLFPVKIANMVYEMYHTRAKNVEKNTEIVDKEHILEVD